MLKIQKWLNHTSRIIMTFSVIALNASAFQMMKLDNATDIELHTGAFIYHIKHGGTHESDIKISVSPVDTEGRYQTLKILCIASNSIALNVGKK
ncbi:hypothetical protein ACET5Y_05535 [Aeromonas veronii]